MSEFCGFGTPVIHSDEITGITKDNLIGKGQYGFVYKGKCRGMTVAVKVPLKQDLTPAARESLEKEVNIMSNLYHPNVCLFMGACLEDNAIRIVSELMSGDLSKLLENKEDKSRFSTRLSWALEAAKGISWMHAKKPPIIHMDIKPDNILFDSDGRIKVCDFGFSAFKIGTQSNISKPTGTPLFMAPEILCARSTTPTKVTEASDVYSFAIVIWEILTKKKAFAHHNNFMTFRKAILSGERPPLPTFCIQSLSFLLNKCWAATPSERPTFPIIVAELSKIIEEYKKFEQQMEVSTDIADNAGKHFWYANFPERSSVSWEEFSSTFCSALNTNSIMFPLTPESLHLRCFKALLLDKQTEEVTRKNFGKLLGWFGILEFPYCNNHILDKILNTLRLPYFFGYMSGTEANATLKSADPGTYLVRFSGNHPNSFCISRVTGPDRQVKHLVVPCRAGRFLFKDVAITNVQQLVDFAAKSDGVASKPYNGERFTALFNGPTEILSSYTYTNEGELVDPDFYTDEMMQ